MCICDVCQKKEKKKEERAPKKIANNKVPVGDYCNASTPVHQYSDSKEIWPASRDQLEAAYEFIRECATAQKRTLIVPDVGADGLTSGVIMYLTLLRLGLNKKYLSVHLVQKGSNIHAEYERKAMALKKPSSWANSFETDELWKVVSGYHCSRIPTIAIMTYEICKQLNPDIDRKSGYGYLCAIGTYGKLGGSIKWTPPFPDMKEIFKKLSKTRINKCASFINARMLYELSTFNFQLSIAESYLARKTGTYDVLHRLDSIIPSFSIPEVNLGQQEADGKILVLKVESEAQIHPFLAERWAKIPRSEALEIVIVANYGYLSGKVDFSCRRAEFTQASDNTVNIIESLKAIANLDTTDLVERLRENFVRGFKKPGGIVNTAEFEELCDLMKLGEMPEWSEKFELRVAPTKES
ncbi:hypothetical protein SBOR_6714 [Sclerotinia borealis F-4128]|uniref:Uncharacterized protein n=1 Tax=Sclerotinia borealis (strain F-4128) TaxID=1432307 RepID=W9CEE4_SCLBF|nr:hypothetical protein SBOR_6714 [Sclerotinia borealis F-4128]